MERNILNNAVKAFEEEHERKRIELYEVIKLK